MTSGMVLGKFLPPHLGHVYLVDFAKNYVDHLTVVVGTLESEPIDGSQRYRWMSELFAGSNVNVVHLDEELPQDPSEHLDFWQIWEDVLRPLVSSHLDYVFASEEYGWKLAEVLDVQFVPVDIDRSVLPVSGTAIRNDPMRHWEYLPRCVRPHYVRRVCIFGPESTGKSTLTSKLAAHFETVGVPEYARTLIESQDGRVDLEDMERIACGQTSSEDALARSANRILVCDTDVLLTTVWSDWLFGDCPDEVTQLARSRQYDLYLLTSVDVPWVADKVRYAPQDRQKFFDRCELALTETKRPYVTLSGDWENRFQTAVSAVNSLLEESL